MQSYLDVMTSVTTVHDLNQPSTFNTDTNRIKNGIPKDLDLIINSGTGVRFDEMLSNPISRQWTGINKIFALLLCNRTQLYEQHFNHNLVQTDYSSNSHPHLGALLILQLTKPACWKYGEKNRAHRGNKHQHKEDMDRGHRRAQIRW